MNGKGGPPRFRVLTAGIAGLIAVWYALGPALAQPTEPLREAWRRPLAGVQCLAISPDGSRVAVVSWTGEVLCWSGGRLRWRRSVPGAAAVVVGAGGRAIVYTPLDALRRDLLWLDNSGRIAGRSTAGGPISVVVLSPDGRVAAVGTASGAVERCPVDRYARPSRVMLSGEVQQLCYDARGGLAAVTANPARLAVFAPDGRVLWQTAAPVGQEFRLGTPPRGDAGPMGVLTIAAEVPVEPPDSGDSVGHSASERSPGAEAERDRIQLVAFSPTGKPVWRQMLSGRDPHLSVMGSSGSVVVAYERAERRGVVLRYDRSLACYAYDGSRRWEHGGMVYNPLLVSASPDGDAVLSLSMGNRFWLLSGRGQTLWSYTTSAPVRIARASADGTAVAVATTDGHLSLLKVSRPGRVAKR